MQVTVFIVFVFLNLIHHHHLCRNVIMGDSMNTAIPREINLGLQKPVATPAYTRRFRSNASTSEITAGSQVTITLDTAQPGSFIDTLSSYLSFKLVFVNTSPTSGYNVSFSACGAHSLIRAMRIYVQGVPIEEITEYNALVEWLHDLTGIPDNADRSAKSRYLANTIMEDQTVYVPPAQTANGSVSQTERIMNIQLPLVSGVLGTMAEKMFPSMLVAPGNCYIQLDMATAATAFRVIEVDTTPLRVATAALATNAGRSTLVNTVPGSAATNSLNAVVVSTLNSNLVTTNPGANTILEEGPLDMPYVKRAALIDGSTTAYNSTDEAGILTTEERIGGGMFNAPSVPYASTTLPLNVPKSCGYSIQDITTENASITIANQIEQITSLSNLSTTDGVFFGGCLQTAGTASQRALNERMTPSSTIANHLTYRIRDLEYVGKQVVVGDDVARAIIERAAAGDISIHTQSYRQYPATLSLPTWQYRIDPAYYNFAESTVIQNGAPLCNGFQRFVRPGGTSFIIPAKISSANAMYHIFRNGQADNDFRFDSLRRMTIGMSDDPASNAGVQAQLRIGNELIPQSPIASASEALEELLKAHHMGGHYGTTEKMGMVVASANQYAWPPVSSLVGKRGVAGTSSASKPLAIGRLQSQNTDSELAIGGVSYVRNDYNSQILCPHPCSVSWKWRLFAPYNSAVKLDQNGPGQPNIGIFTASDGLLGANYFFPLGHTCDNAGDNADTTRSAVAFYGVHGSASRQQQDYMNVYIDAPTDPNTTNQQLVIRKVGESQQDYADRKERWRQAVKRAFFGYADDRSDHQITHPSLPNFMNPYKQHTGRYSTFMLGFDLDTFSHNSDTVRSGHYLGNNTVSLNLSSLEFVDNSPLNTPLCSSVRMDTYVLHDLRLSFQQGGIVQAFY